MAVTSAKMPDALDKTLTKLFSDAYREAPMDYKELFGQESDSTDYVKYSSVSTLGDIPAFTGGTITNLENEQLYDKTLTHVEYAAKYTLQRKLMDDNKWKEIFDGVTLLGRSARITKEKNHFLILNNAWTDEPSDGDGCELCASDHPYSPTDSGTQSNEGTTTFAPTALTATQILMRKFNNAKRQNANILGDAVIVPVDLYDTARETINSTAKVVATWSSGVTNVESGYKIYTSTYLTDAASWFMVDTKAMKRNLLSIQRMPLEFATTDDFDTFQKWCRVYERYSKGWFDWRFIYGHLV